jgi:hypothetical protein
MPLVQTAAVSSVRFLSRACSGHLTVRRGDRKSQLPMHGSRNTKSLKS